VKIVGSNENENSDKGILLTPSSGLDTKRKEGTRLIQKTGYLIHTQPRTSMAAGRLGIHSLPTNDFGSASHKTNQEPSIEINS